MIFYVKVRNFGQNQTCYMWSHQLGFDFHTQIQAQISFGMIQGQVFVHFLHPLALFFELKPNYFLAVLAEDNLRFVINWLEQFPAYKDSELFLTGESYAGISKGI